MACAETCSALCIDPGSADVLQKMQQVLYTQQPVIETWHAKGRAGKRRGIYVSDVPQPERENSTKPYQVHSGAASNSLRRIVAFAGRKLSATYSPLASKLAIAAMVINE